MPNIRYVDLWLQEFRDDPYKVAKKFPRPPSLIMRKGDPHRAYTKAPRNVLVYTYEFPYDDPASPPFKTTWSEAIEGLMKSLGGWQKVYKICADLDGGHPPGIQFTLPVRGSPHQENNFIDLATLVRLTKLKADLGMEFSHYRVLKIPKKKR
jgi:hypothetical protein